jgi:hypothetical protein
MTLAVADVRPTVLRLLTQGALAAGTQVNNAPWDR